MTTVQLFSLAGTLNFAPEEFFDNASIPKRRERIVRGLKAHGFAGLDEVILEPQDALSGTPSILLRRKAW
jgi:hypothetical protein